MTSRRLRLLLSLPLLVLAVVACDQGRKVPPKTTVTVVNAAPSYSALSYIREHPVPGNSATSLAYANSSTFEYDEDTYDFNVGGVDPATGAPVDLKSFPQHVVAGTDYTFVLAESAGAIEPKVLEAPKQPAGATDSQIVLLHAAEAAPPMDVFFEQPGADLLAATPWGTVSFLGSLPAKKVAAGTYQISLTESGNRANVLMRSTNIVLTAGKNVPLVINSATGSSSVDLGVIALTDTPTVAIDVNAPALLRAINAANDGAPRDVVINGTTVLAATPFATPTPYVPVPIGAALPFTVQPAGNPGVIELNTAITPESGRIYTSLITGDAGTLAQTLFVDDNRRIRAPAGGSPKISFFDAAPQFTALDILVVDSATTDLSTLIATLVLSPPGGSGQVSYAAGDWFLFVRQSGTSNVVAGPIAMHLDGGGLYDVVITNGPDTATANVALRGDFP